MMANGKEMEMENNVHTPNKAGAISSSPSPNLVSFSPCVVHHHHHHLIFYYSLLGGSLVLHPPILALVWRWPGPAVVGRQRRAPS
jgi:hypothetical protein